MKAFTCNDTDTCSACASNCRISISDYVANFGKWLVTIVGVLGAFIALVLCYIPPSQITTGSPVVYVGLLVKSIGYRHTCIIVR